MNQSKAGRGQGKQTQNSRSRKSPVVINLTQLRADRAKRQQRSKRFNPSRSLPSSSVAAAYSTGQQTGIPQTIRKGYNSTRIVHKELISSVSGSSGFAVSTFPINPGLSATFPWLSVQATGWEKYYFHSIRFCYYTRTGSTTTGSLTLAPDFDAADAGPTTEQIVSTYSTAVEDAPWKNITLTLDRDRINIEKYIRLGGIGANLDIKTYDLANLYVCSVDGANVGWGKLWVEYDVELINPQTPPTGQSNFATLFANTASGTGLSPALPFGTGAESTAGYYAPSSDGINDRVYFANLTVGVKYIISMYVQGTGFTVLSLASGAGFTANVDFGTSCIKADETYAEAAKTYTATSTTGYINITCTGTTVVQSLCSIGLVAASAGF